MSALSASSAEGENLSFTSGVAAYLIHLMGKFVENAVEIFVPFSSTFDMALRLSCQRSMAIG
jgi:hypothetical protein